MSVAAPRRLIAPVRWLIAVLLTVGVAVSGAAAAAAPAYADTLMDGAAHVWSPYPSAASYTVPIVGTWDGWNTYSYARNSGNGPIVITRYGTGSYLVRFGGLGAVTDTGGVAHAQAYGQNAHYCTVGGWGKSGADILISVYCFTTGGARQDTQFVASFTTPKLREINSYLWADKPTATSTYVPADWYRYDYTDGTHLVTRDGVGQYRAYLPVAHPDGVSAFYQTTAYGASPVICKVAGYLGNGVVRVQCRDSAGNLVDSRFTLSYSRHNMLMQIAPSAMSYAIAAYPVAHHGVWFGWNSDSSLVHLRTVTRVGQGRYRVYYPQILSYYGHAAAYAAGYQDARCHVASWYPTGAADMYVNVACVNSAGAAVDTPFYVGFTW